MMANLLLFLLLPVMNSQGTVESLTTSEQQQDEVMAQLQPFQRVQLTNNEVLCDFVHDSFLKRNGIIFNFINSNATGATNLIGGVRIALMDIRKVPAYCAKYKDGIKKHGLRLMSQHFLDTQCGAGATEFLSLEDYGISFSLASVSSTGITLNPTGRNEGPLWFCLYPGLVEPTCLSEVSWEDGKASEATYLINAYIHLLPASQRRHRLLSKAKADSEVPKEEDEASKNAKKPRTFFASPMEGVSRYPPGTMNYRGYHERKMQEEFESLRAELTAVKSKSAQEIAALKAHSALNPALPKTNIIWPPKYPNQGPDLPDE